MQSTSNNEKINRTVALYNIIPSVFWSVINLTPIVVFCYNSMSTALIIIFSAAGLLTLLIPNSFLNVIMLGKTTSIYKKTGVTFINKFTQNGSVINKLIRKKYPAYRVVAINKKSFDRLLKQTYIFEKFHLIVFIFFTLVTIYALIKSYFVWAMILSITNLIYNVYPTFLQQYLRLKLALFGKRSSMPPH